MTTVRDAAFELFRARGMTTIFGNPGSTELPMLGPFPRTSATCSGCRRRSRWAWPTASRRRAATSAHVNLHTAPGLGNGVGAIFNARANKAPLLVTAGQQARSLITMQANLTNRDAVEVPKPYVKWSNEPPRAADVPFALAQAIHHASLPPQGPAFVSIPMDDWAAEIAPVDYATQIARTVGGRAQADPARGGGARQAPAHRRAPRVRRGPRDRRERRLGRGGRARRVAAPARVGLAGDRRRAHRLPRGPPRLPGRAAARGRRRSRRRSRATTSCSSPAPRCSPTTPTSPATSCPRARELVAITSDPDEAARAPMGDAIVADVALTLRALVHELAARAGGQPDSDPPSASRPTASRRPRASSSTRRRQASSCPAARCTRPRRAVPPRRDRRARVAVEHRRAAQQPAPVAPRLLLLQRRRRPRLRAVGVARRAARAARAPGRVRARRGLRAVRDHRVLDRRRLLDPRQVPRAAQQRVLDPQVVRDARERRGRARPRPAEARRRRDRRQLRRAVEHRQRARRAARRRSPTRSRRTARGSCRSTSPRGWPSREIALADRWAALA